MKIVIILLLLAVIGLNSQTKRSYTEYVYKFDSRKAYVNKHEKNKSTLIFPAEKKDSITINSESFREMVKNSKLVEIVIELVDVKTNQKLSSYLDSFKSESGYLMAVLPYAYYGKSSPCLYTIINEKLYVGITNTTKLKASQYDYDIVLKYRFYN